MKLARPRLGGGAHCRALALSTHGLTLPSSADPSQSYTTSRPRVWMARELPSAEAAALMHRAYLRTDEPDGLLALARDARPGSLAEERHALRGGPRARDARSLLAALNCYQIALQAPPRGARGTSEPPCQRRTGRCCHRRRHVRRREPRPAGRCTEIAGWAAVADGRDRSACRPPAQWQLGLCRSLRHLGLFVTMRDSATAAFRHANTPLERSQLLPCVVQAAWRLGKWEDVRNLLATCDYPSSATTWNSGYAARRWLPPPCARDALCARLADDER